LARAEWDGSRLVPLKERFVSDVVSEASRIVLGRDVRVEPQPASAT
jgi:hypothetical protein